MYEVFQNGLREGMALVVHCNISISCYGICDLVFIYLFQPSFVARLS